MTSRALFTVKKYIALAIYIDSYCALYTPRLMNIRTQLLLPSTSRMATTSASSSLDRLENVLNARDLASATKNIAPGRIFRSGNPARATAHDVKILRHLLSIRQMIDFRSAEEQKEDCGWSLMLSNGIMKSYDQEGRLTEISYDDNVALQDINLPRCELHRISLIERQNFIKALIWRLPPRKVAVALAYKLFGMHEQMREVLVPEIYRGGLPLVYEILLSSAAADIGVALELIVEAAEAKRPQLLFCKLGKDRTGVMSALVQACCGASDGEIIADYSKSNGVDKIALGGLEKMKDVQGMEQGLFAQAPPEAMRVTLDYAKQKYGGLAKYMESIGFGKDRQSALANALSPNTLW